MKWHRIWALFLRHVKSTIFDFQRVILIVYWSILNIIIWATTSIWISQHTHMPELLMMILTGLVFWQIVFRVNLETAKSLYQEITDHNLINIFITGLTLPEWICAIMLLGILDMVMVITCATLCVYLFYALTIFSIGLLVIPSMILLLISGWIIGFTLSGLILHFGKKAQDLIYSFGYIFAPFSAIYYPVDALPSWIQTIAYALPTTYVFESFRYTIAHNAISWGLLSKSLALNILYVTIALFFFSWMFKRAKQRGLAQLS